MAKHREDRSRRRWLCRAILAFAVALVGALTLVQSATAAEMAGPHWVSSPLGAPTLSDTYAGSADGGYLPYGAEVNVIGFQKGTPHDGNDQYALISMTPERAIWVWAGALSNNRDFLGLQVPRDSSPDDWARLRQCESGGNYGINTDNGFYGAYQFDRRTWSNHADVPTANLASPQAQDEKAYATFDARGWEPWPGCARKLGLRFGLRD